MGKVTIQAWMHAAGLKSLLHSFKIRAYLFLSTLAFPHTTIRHIHTNLFSSLFFNSNLCQYHMYVESNVGPLCPPTPSSSPIPNDYDATESPWFGEKREKKCQYLRNRGENEKETHTQAELDAAETERDQRRSWRRRRRRQRCVYVSSPYFSYSVSRIPFHFNWEFLTFIVTMNSSSYSSSSSIFSDTLDLCFMSFLKLVFLHFPFNQYPNFHLTSLPIVSFYFHPVHHITFHPMYTFSPI